MTRHSDDTDANTGADTGRDADADADGDAVDPSDPRRTSAPSRNCSGSASSTSTSPPVPPPTSSPRGCATRSTRRWRRWIRTGPRSTGRARGDARPQGHRLSPDADRRRDPGRTGLLGGKQGVRLGAGASRVASCGLPRRGRRIRGGDLPEAAAQERGDPPAPNPYDLRSRRAGGRRPTGAPPDPV